MLPVLRDRRCDSPNRRRRSAYSMKCSSGQFPGLAADLDAGNGRLAQAEDGELGVAVVFAAAAEWAVTVVPHAGLAVRGWSACLRVARPASAIRSLSRSQSLAATRAIITSDVSYVPPGS